MPSTPQQVTPSSNPYLGAIQWGGWEWTDGATPGTNITYFIDTGGTDLGGGLVSVAWLPYEIAAYQAALQTWANVANISFTQVFSVGEANLVEFVVGDPSLSFLGFHETPEDASVFGNAFGVYNFLGTGFTQAGLQAGGYGFITFVHELGHALGLAHPHDTGGGSGVFPGVTVDDSSDLGDNELNQGIFTTMTYNDGWNVFGPSTSLEFGWQSGPMAFDIAAIQYLYGANTTYHTGNDVYVIGAAQMMTCIWDAGGTDTIAYNGTNAVTINLNEATLQNAPGGGGFVSYANGATSISDDYWSAFTIANGVVIENATGGSGSDNIHLTSQNVNNLIDGNGGSDTVWVTYNFGSGYSVQAGSTASNLVLIGAAGTDTLLDSEFVHFADGTVVSTADLITQTPDDVPYDFNNDGKSDILWQNTNGTVATWLMNGTQVAQSQTVGVAGAGWQINGADDFNGDSKSDILWQNTNGTVALWLMDGTQVAQSQSVGVAGTGWQITGTDDFNGDGKSDILWQNTNGTVALWLMNGTQVAQSQSVGVAGAGWQIAGTDDFNGDGKSDILWQNTNGTVALWLMNGTQVAQSQSVGVAGAGWQISGTGDYDGDGKSDILWQNTNGTVALWLMNGTQVAQSQTVGVAGAGWQIAGTGDYGGDGMSDILWQNTNGSVALWEMNGTQVATSQSIGNVGAGWQIM